MKSLSPHPSFLSPIPRARHRDVQVSHDAAKVAARQSGKQITLIRKLVENSPEPLAVEQISDICGLSVPRVAKRVSDLVSVGKFEDSGQKHTNESGCPATKWRVRVADGQLDLGVA